MSTLVLGGADALLGAGVKAAGSLASSALGAVLSPGAPGPRVRTSEGPRLSEMHGLGSTEGAPIPRVYGRARIGGQLIWATRFEEVANTTTAVERSRSRGGKSLGGGRSRTTATVSTTYSYRANLAVGLCEGPVAAIRRVWADGRELDLSGLTMRLHRGTPDQGRDPLIVAKEGAENVPAYRGLAYVVFEGLPLDRFGNRVPQLSFEVVRPPPGLPDAIRSVCLIPGSTEFGYDTTPVFRTFGLGAAVPENTHQLARDSDVRASLDHLGAVCPNLAGVSLVVSWFGTDLRAGSCRVEPRVDANDKATSGGDWSVAGLTRATAAATSRSGGAAAYGGTPSDASVIRLLGELKARGLRVTLYPFLMMDVPAGNDLPDPRTGAAGQPPYPWRGRITCDPAPDRPGTVDGTADAAAQVAAFFGGAAPGPSEWSFGRLVLHYAGLAAAAGGVDAFVIGSELVGLTRVRDGSGYPAVAALRALAADVRAILGPGTKLTYAADWTEYGAHVRDGGATVRFPLDPLWADPNIDAVGIDYYPPITDWRDGPGHRDEGQGRGPHDPAHLLARLGSGEAFDWFYPDEAARAAQNRVPITDGAGGEPWLYRPKDLVGWWSNVHRERTGGVPGPAPTPWLPGGKPIWLTEVGIPAVDKGPNGPNVFPDPKSAEGAIPPFSTGGRDDLVQARALEAVLTRFDPRQPGHDPAFNPPSPAYPGRMVDPDRIAVWCWDARPFPAFPDFRDVWADGRNWNTGHWITGRIDGAPLDRLVSAILADHGLPPSVRPPLDGFVDGYVLDRPLSARAALEPLAELFGFDPVPSGNAVAWRTGREPVHPVPRDALAEWAGESLLVSGRRQETELPASLELRFVDADGDYAQAAVGSRRLAGTSRREAVVDLPAVIGRGEALRLADGALRRAWSGRDTTRFRLSPRALAVEPGDLVRVADGPLLRVTRILDGPVRTLEAETAAPAATETVRDGSAGPRAGGRPPARPGPPAVEAFHLPAFGPDPVALAHLAVAASPWPGAVGVWRRGEGGGFALLDVLDLPALVGRTASPFPAGPVWRWDERSRLDLDLSGGSLMSVAPEAALAGETLYALRGPDGVTEVFGARTAELIGPGRWRLSGLLRGLGGTETAAGRAVPAGAAIVRLDGAVAPLTTRLDDLGRSFALRVGPANREPTDPSAVEESVTVGSAALRPLSPVRLRARRVPDGVAISWIRRTRRDGDGWDVEEVPLGEEDERYGLDILRDGAVLRTVEATRPGLLYPAADELADFGAPQARLSLRVAQLSRAVGRGEARAALVTVA